MSGWLANNAPPPAWRAPGQAPPVVAAARQCHPASPAGGGGEPAGRMGAAVGRAQWRAKGGRREAGKLDCFPPPSRPGLALQA